MAEEAVAAVVGTDWGTAAADAAAAGAGGEQKTAPSSPPLVETPEPEPDAAL